MTFYAAGWRVWRDTDTQGRNYWRATRNGYQCGAHTRRSLMTLCAGMPVDQPHRGTRDEPAHLVQLTYHLDTPPSAVVTDAAHDDRRIA